MPHIVRKLTLLLATLLPTFFLTGCFLQLLSGNTIYTANLAEGVNEIITTVFAHSSATVCSPTDFGYYECVYIVNGNPVTSTMYLLEGYGLWGVVIDPVVVQVPEDASLLEATYDDGTGKRDLLVWTETSFQAQPGITVTAETGHKFFIMEFPASVAAGLPAGNPANGKEFDTTFRYQVNRPITETVTAQPVKVMFTGRVMINGHNYFPPLLPCTTNFADIPAIEIPLAQNPANLLPAVDAAWQSNPPAPCDHKAYYYYAAPPKAPPSLFLPALVH